MTGKGRHKDVEVPQAVEYDLEFQLQVFPIDNKSLTRRETRTR